MKAVLTEDKKTTLDEAMLSTIREDRIKRLKSEINKGKTKIYLHKDWTLEYEIAGSGLYRLLVTATRAAKIETDNLDLEMTDYHLIHKLLI